MTCDNAQSHRLLQRDRATDATTCGSRSCRPASGTAPCTTVRAGQLLMGITSADACTNCQRPTQPTPSRTPLSRAALCRDISAAASPPCLSRPTHSPGQRLVAAPLDHLQVPDLDAADTIVGDLQGGKPRASGSGERRPRADINSESGRARHAVSTIPEVCAPSRPQLLHTSNLTLMGGRRPCCSSSAATEGSPNLQRSRNSRPPGKFLIFHTSASFSGAYTAEPCRRAGGDRRQRQGGQGGAQVLNHTIVKALLLQAVLPAPCKCHRALYHAPCTCMCPPPLPAGVLAPHL